MTRPSVVSALGRPPFVAALGVITLLVVVWAAAAPRPARVIPGLHPDAVLEQQAAPGGFSVYDPDFKLNRVPGPWNQTSDGIALVLGWAVIGLLVAGAAFLVLVMVRAWLAGREDRSTVADDAADLDLEALAVAVSTDASGRLIALSAGTPAEGIIAAWAHLEATIHEAGVPLSPSRTSTEVSLDVLRRFAVDETTLRTLAALYREARWSRHPLTEGDRTRAATAYRELDIALRAGMPEGSRGERG
ncbi:MAG TPA: DUF4129 domain-containing protein [Ornithinibacter sp.]|nr:DUF4129 domain-containing protein [Ornithinibacter sp.]